MRAGDGGGPDTEAPTWVFREGKAHDLTPPSPEYIADVLNLLTSQPPEGARSAEWRLAQVEGLVDAVDPSEGLSAAQKLVKAANGWLGRVAHPDSCQCHLCTASRRILSVAATRGLLPVLRGR